MTAGSKNERDADIPYGERRCGEDDETITFAILFPESRNRPKRQLSAGQKQYDAEYGFGEDFENRFN